MSPLLAVENLTLVAGARVLCSDLHCELRAHERWAILGLNGAGKTTLLHTLAGLRSPAAGRILLRGSPLAGIPRRTAARIIGLLPQDTRDEFPATVFETALLGRTPFLSAWARETEEDRSRTQAALAATGLEGLAQRPVTTLSGGERRRLAFATVLAQDPTIWLLDEPTNHLDLRHQALVLERIRSLMEKGAACMMTLHDPNLAARHADQVLLLYGDGRWEAGNAEDLLTAERLSGLYGTPIAAVETAMGKVFLPG